MRLAWLVAFVCAGCWTRVVTVDGPPPAVLVVDHGGPPGGRADVGGDVDGRWVGRGYQYNNNSSWDIDMAVDARSGTGAIAYPELGCSGELYVERGDAWSLQVRERITVNPGNVCVDGGTIKLVMRADGALDWRYYYASGGEGAAAVMTRR
ncbi:MAG: hypothetical protein KF773_05830 [Deltaproteobacteria bacterium]|nr:hypothetical protein [Deltaproteobacteria bacterium]MCW5802186.1 hypothetical protein [Deltaproteobacteria bacterium]